MDVRASRRNRLFFQTAFMLFATQFGVSYYCIYEVDWIGWDLFEPLTYTIGQGLFVSGLIYSFRHLGKDTAFTSMDSHYKSKRLERWYLKNGIDPDRLRFLKEELAAIDHRI